MKAKTLVACAFAVSAASAWAAMPGGPQGTGSYGAANGAVPLPQTVPPGYVYAGPQTAVPDNSVNRDALADQTAIDRDPPRDARQPARRWVLQGPSWATNPPAPAL